MRHYLKGKRTDTVRLETCRRRSKPKKSVWKLSRGESRHEHMTHVAYLRINLVNQTGICHTRKRYNSDKTGKRHNLPTENLFHLHLPFFSTTTGVHPSKAEASTPGAEIKYPYGARR